MVQTEWLSPDAVGWEISPIIEHQNAAKQTVRRPQKGKEKALKPSGFKAFPVAGAEGLEVASQPLLRCPKKSSGCRFSSIFSTAAPTPARCIRHRRRSQALPGTPHFAREGACAADGIHRREDAVNIRRPFHGQRIFGAPCLPDRSARTKKIPIHLWVYRYFFGRGRRARTLGTRFWRPLLYQLSYAPMETRFGDRRTGLQIPPYGGPSGTRTRDQPVMSRLL